MNIAFDIHGTLDKHKSLRNMLWILSKLQHVTSRITPYVISGPPADQIRDEMKALGLPNMVKVISVVDFLKSRHVEMWQDDNGNWWCAQNFWWRSKAQICDEYKIDVLIDNEVKYKKYISNNTTFLLVK